MIHKTKCFVCIHVCVICKATNLLYVNHHVHIHVILFRFKRKFGETMHRAKPYSLNSEFCKDLAAEMVSSGVCVNSV